jgi:putative tricarboxylic transport membrane protein
MIAGLLLGLVGFRYTVGGNFLTFGIQELEQGIPLITFGFSALIIPFFYRQFSLEYKSTLNNTVGASVDYVSSRWTYIRSSVLGWVLGLVPGLSYVVSASGSYSLEKKYRLQKNNIIQEIQTVLWPMKQVTLLDRLAHCCLC